MDFQAQLSSQEYLETRAKELDRMFENGGVTVDIRQIKQMLLSSQDITNILEEYRNQLSGKQYKFIQNVLGSSRFAKWKDQLQNHRQDAERNSNKLDQLFAHENITSDISELKEAIFNNENYDHILQKYEDEFRGKQIKAIKSVLRSKQFESFVQENRGVKWQIQKLFAHINADTAYLQKLLLENKKIGKQLAELEEDLPRRVFNEIQAVLESEQLRKLLKDLKANEQTEKIQKIFAHELIKTDISDLVEALIQKRPIDELMKNYELKMTGKELKALRKIVNSSQLQILIETNDRQEKSQTFDSLFPKVKVDLKELKQAALNCQNVSAILGQYEDELKVSEFREVQKIVYSEQFQNFVKSIKVGKTKQKICALLSQKFNLKHINSEMLIEKILKRENNSVILQLYSLELTGSQLKTLKQFLQSNQLLQIVIQDQLNESTAHLQNQFRQAGIKISCSQLIQALINNQETKTKAILQQFSTELSGRQYKIVQNLVGEFRVFLEQKSGSMNQIKKFNSNQRKNVRRLQNEKRFVKFQENRKKKLDKLLDKFDRKKIFFQIYQNLLEIYNNCLKQNNEDFTINEDDFSFDEKDKDWESFQVQQRDKFIKRCKVNESFQTSDDQLIRNIRQESQNIGCLPLKFLNMSEYYQENKLKNYISVTTYKLKQSLNVSNFILKNIRSKFQNFQSFVGELHDEFSIVGVDFRKSELLQYVAQYFKLVVLNNLIQEKPTLSKYSYQLKSYNFQWYQQKYNDSQLRFKIGKYHQERFQIIDWLNKCLKQKAEKDNKAEGQVSLEDQKKEVEQEEQESKENETKLNWLNQTQQLLKFLKTIRSQALQKQQKQRSIRFRYYDQEGLKNRLDQQSIQEILLKILDYAIDKYVNHLKNQKSGILQQLKDDTQKLLQSKIENDLKLINLHLVNQNSLSDYQTRKNLEFDIIDPNFKYTSLEQANKIVQSFSQIWSRSYSSYKFFQREENLYFSLFQNERLVVGYYEQTCLSIIQGYRNHKILKNYGNEQNKLKDLGKQPQMNSFVKEQLKYEKVLDEIVNELKSLDLPELTLKQIISTMLNKIDAIVEQVNLDLRQVSHKVTEKFVAQLHNFAFHAIWKLKEGSEWSKKQNLLIEFSISMKDQIEKLTAEEQSLE